MQVLICLVGASGRMGLEIISSVEAANLKQKQAEENLSSHPGSSNACGIAITLGIVEPGNVAVGQMIPGIARPIQSECSESDEGLFNVVVDFSSRQGTLRALNLARQRNLPALICSTGLTLQDEETVREAAQNIPIVRAANTSVGVNVLLALAKEASQFLSDSFDIELLEIHHRRKKDAPSGTALSFLQAIRAGIEQSDSLSPELRAIRGSQVVSQRLGETGSRKPEEIGLMALRGGDVAGEHTVFFLADGERIELTHRASSPRIFAEGALKAAAWLVREQTRGVTQGLFSMADVLGLNKDKKTCS